MTRDQMENHLTLHGWVCLDWGKGGASKEGRPIVYTFMRKSDELIEVATDTSGDPNHKAAIQNRALDCWIMSDDYFWPMARKCMELDAQRNSQGANHG